MVGKFVIAHIDNILNGSSSYQGYFHHIKQVLFHLLKNQLYVKLENCEFHVSTVLGYINQ